VELTRSPLHTVPALCFLPRALLPLPCALRLRTRSEMRLQNDDLLINVGRIGLCFTLLCGFPLLVLPCRNAAQRLMVLIPKMASDCCSARDPMKQALISGRHGIIGDAPMTPTTRKIRPTNEDGAPPILPLGQHILLTLGLLSVVCYLAMSVPGVTVIWSIMGSSTAIIIAFILPSACYIKIRKNKGSTKIMLGAKVMLGLSVPLCLLCTFLSVYNVVVGG
jgi:hypothetical protein